MREVLTANDRRNWLDRAVDTLDRAVFAVAPRWGARRMATRALWRHSRNRLDKIENHIREGREDDAFHRGNWLASHLSPDSALEERLDKLRLRSRELYETDPFAAGAVESLVTQVVGTGLRYQSRIRPIPGILSAEQATELNRRIEEVAKRQFCRIDITLTQTIVDIQAQAVRGKGIDGEAFIRMTARRDKDKPLPLTLEVIDPDRVETPPDLTGNPLVRMGIERDDTGRVIAYHVRRKNPYDTIDTNFLYDRVPADEMIHWFDKLWPSQSRGLPWFAPVLALLKDIGDYREAELISRQVRACYAVFIKTDTDPDEIAEAQSAGRRDRHNRREEELTPGKILYGRTGEEATSLSPNGNDGAFPAYIEWQLRAAAAGLNFPYELLAKDYSRTTYSSGRLSLIDGRTNFARQQQSLDEKLLSRVSRQLTDEFFTFYAPQLKSIGINAYDFNNNPWPFYACNWIAPGWPWIDPVKDVEASRGALDGDLTTEALELAARGLDQQETHEIRLGEKLEKLRDWARLRKEAIALEIPEAEIPLALGIAGKTAQAAAVAKQTDPASTDNPTDSLATAA